MPISAPRSVGTAPAFYNYLKLSRPIYPGKIYDNGTLYFDHQVCPTPSFLPLPCIYQILSVVRSGFTRPTLVIRTRFELHHIPILQPQVLQDQIKEDGYLGCVCDSKELWNTGWKGSRTGLCYFP